MLSLRLLRLASTYQLLSTALVGLGVALVWPDKATAVVAGGLVMSVNFWALRTLVHKTLTPGAGRAFYALALGLKLVAVFAVLAFLILGLRLDPVGVMAGLCTLFLGLFPAVLHQSRSAEPAPQA
jgi:hypothetical protein